MCHDDDLDGDGNSNERYVKQRYHSSARKIHQDMVKRQGRRARHPSLNDPPSYDTVMEYPHDSSDESDGDTKKKQLEPLLESTNSMDKEPDQSYQPVHYSKEPPGAFRSFDLPLHTTARSDGELDRRNSGRSYRSQYSVPHIARGRATPVQSPEDGRISRASNASNHTSRDSVQTVIKRSSSRDSTPSHRASQSSVQLREAIYRQSDSSNKDEAIYRQGDSLSRDNTLNRRGMRDEVVYSQSTNVRNDPIYGQHSVSPRDEAIYKQNNVSPRDENIYKRSNSLPRNKSRSKSPYHDPARLKSPYQDPKRSMSPYQVMADVHKDEPKTSDSSSGIVNMQTVCGPPVQALTPYDAGVQSMGSGGTNPMDIPLTSFKSEKKKKPIPPPLIPPGEIFKNKCRYPRPLELQHHNHDLQA